MPELGKWMFFLRIYRIGIDHFYNKYHYAS